MQGMVSGYRVRMLSPKNRWRRPPGGCSSLRKEWAIRYPRDLVESAAIDLIESGYDERLVSAGRKAYCNHGLLAAI
jgi:hypothetical protein